MGKVGYLSELHAKYFDAGLRVVAISSEPVDTLQKKMLTNAGAKFWIGSDPDGKTHARYVDGGGTGIPHFYLVGADGKVVSDSLPTEAALRELLEKPLRLDKDKVLHQKVARARLLYDAGVFGAASRAAAPLRQDADAAVAADATLLCDKIAGHGDFLRKVQAAETGGDPNERYGTMLRMAMQFDGLDAGKWALGQVAELKKHERVKSFLPEWAKLENAMRTEMQADGKPDKVRAAKLLYDEVAKKYSRSLVGKLATDHAARLGGAK